MLKIARDEHLHPGSLVNAKICHVTALAECHGCFDGSATMKHVNDIVISHRDAFTSGIIRAFIFVTAHYQINENIIQGVELILHSMNVGAVTYSLTTPGVPAPVIKSVEPIIPNLPPLSPPLPHGAPAANTTEQLTTPMCPTTKIHLPL